VADQIAFPEAMPRSFEADLLGPNIKQLLHGNPERIASRIVALLIQRACKKKAPASGRHLRAGLLFFLDVIR
jgi:hypothetical protein